MITNTIYIDCDKFIPDLDQEKSHSLTEDEKKKFSKNNSLAVAIAFSTGILTSPVIQNKRQFLRLAIPPRTLTGNHLDYIADAIGKLYELRD